MIKVGDKVKVLYPFNDAYPDTYIVEAVMEDGVCIICGDRSFDPKFLEVVDDE